MATVGMKGLSEESIQ